MTERESLQNKFLNNLNSNTKLTDKNCITILAYSDTDDFLPRLRKRLKEIERLDLAKQYNDWLANYKKEKDKQDREVSRWLSSRINDWYNEKLRKENRRKEEQREVESCNQELIRHKEQLLQKKLRLLKKKSYS